MIYIISHGRPFNQRTYNLLRARGYTGFITVVLDDEDNTIDDYIKVFSEDEKVSIFIFNKQDIINITDTGVVIPHRNFAVFARNAVERHAEKLKLDYFWVFDDDVTDIRLRYIFNDSLKSIKITSNLDYLFVAAEKFLLDANLCMLGFGTANNYIGGISAVNKESSKFRLCYNAYLRNSAYSVNWFLNILEDRITSITQNRLGNMCIQVLSIQVDTLPLGGVIDGGNSDTYRNTTKFYQSFFPILVYPDCNYIRYTRNSFVLMFNECGICPKLISSKYRRTR